jgi:hypothetical protein
MANRNSNRVVFYVRPDASGERWVVSSENGNFRQEFDTKGRGGKICEAKSTAEDLAQVRVHRSDGNMDYESTYGEDPPDTPARKHTNATYQAGESL